MSVVRRTEGYQYGLSNATCCEPLAFRRTRLRVAGGCERIVRVVEHSALAMIAVTTRIRASAIEKVYAQPQARQ